MNPNYLTPKDWTYLYKKYPGLQASLEYLSILNEYNALMQESCSDYLKPERRQWVTERLNHLNKWYIEP